MTCWNGNLLTGTHTATFAGASAASVLPFPHPYGTPLWSNHSHYSTSVHIRGTIGTAALQPTSGTGLSEAATGHPNMIWANTTKLMQATPPQPTASSSHVTHSTSFVTSDGACKPVRVYSWLLFLVFVLVSVNL